MRKNSQNENSMIISDYNNSVPSFTIQEDSQLNSNSNVRNLTKSSLKSRNET